MAAEPTDDLQEQMRDWMEAAQKPQPPLSSTELKKIRLLLQETENRQWLWKRIKVTLPWAISIVASVAAGWKWLIDLAHGPK